MRFEERQEKIQQQCYDAIDELADEFNLDVPYYPEVFWVGRTINFEDLGLSGHYEEEFNFRKGKRSYFLYKPKIIILNKPKNVDITEESSHFLHMVNSKYRFKGRTREDELYLRILCETIGFFGSKFLYPGRKKSYHDLHDLSLVPIEELEDVFQGYEDYFTEIYIYQQASGLGESLYINYMIGNIPKKQIKNLFSNPFKRKNATINKFYELRQKFWPFEVNSLKLT